MRFLILVPVITLSLLACHSAASYHESPESEVMQQDKFPAVSYPWMTSVDSLNTVHTRFACPEGYSRVPVESGSFGEWLRHLPLHPADHDVLLYNGQKKNRQDVHAAVVNIDVGKTDLQQCADAVMRLRSEYLFSRQQYSAIHFNYTSGDKCDYTEWSNGTRLIVKGNKVERGQISARNAMNDRNNFSRYLQNVFMYAGSLSLSREMKAVPADSMQIGDVFIFGGTPGHAVIVVDMCMNEKGEKLFMIAQSYMPAQEIHILRNPDERKLSPWYPLNFGTTLETPEWDFGREELKRF